MSQRRRGWLVLLGGLACVWPVCGQAPRGPYAHQVLSARSTDGLNWTRDAGVRLEHASVPCAVADGDRVLLYFVDADRGPGQPESTACAVSRDGLRFERQSLVIEGLPVRKAVDPCVMKDADGRFRLYYLGVDHDGDPAAAPGPHRIHLALSSDGIHFREAGVAFEYPDLVDPDVFYHRGTWFMYVFARGRTVIATSADGRRFQYRQDLSPTGYGTVAPLALDDGRLRLYAFEQFKPVGNALVSFLSSDGLDWTRETGIRLQADPAEQLTDPYVIRWRGEYRMYYKTNAAEQVAAGPDGPDGDQPGPWDHDVLVYRVAPDGATERLESFARAGVPTVARLGDGRLVAAHQHFPADRGDEFDKVAVRFSSDDGRRWTPAQVIRLDGLPAGWRFPFDPTLVPLPDGRVRLYFTSTPGRPPEPGLPAIYSAVSADGLTYTFEPGQRFGVAGRAVIDCAVALHRGVFHLWAPDNGTGQPPGAADEGVPPRPGVAYHATSTDGLAFTRQADVFLDGGRRWLGNAQSHGNRLIFFGTADGGPEQPGGIWWATSSDGATWDKSGAMSRIAGADPGAVRLRDGSWLILVTGPPRPGTPSANRGPRPAW